MTTDTWVDLMMARRGGKPFNGSLAFYRAFRQFLKKNGVTYFPAKFDDAGNCETCGEAGRCPGAHILGDALRRAANG